MTNNMRAVIFTGPEQLEIRELKRPEPKEDEVLIKVKSCNICTTEQGQYLGKRPLDYPYIGGHEFGGIVEMIGNNCMTDIKIGDHVAIGYPYCGKCYYCRKGIYTKCSDLYAKDIRYENYTGMFGFADYICVPIKTVYSFNKDIPFEEISFEEPLGTVLHGQKRLKIMVGDVVVIFGAGTMGLLNMMVAHLKGATTIVVDIDDERLKKAIEAGADFVINSSKSSVEKIVKEYTKDVGADHVIVAVGNTNVNNEALRNVRHSGNVLFFAAGYPKPEISLDPNELHYSEVALIGTYGGDPDDFRAANTLINSRKINTRHLLDKKFGVMDSKNAFKLATSGKSYRVIVEFD